MFFTSSKCVYLFIFLYKNIYIITISCDALKVVISRKTDFLL